jgi:hypothetical protein
MRRTRSTVKKKISKSVNVVKGSSQQWAKPTLRGYAMSEHAYEGGMGGEEWEGGGGEIRLARETRGGEESGVSTYRCRAHSRCVDARMVTPFTYQS